MIEVRELVIKANVSASGSQPGGGAGGGGQTGASDNNGVNAGDEMINTCIEKILEILKQKNER